MVTPRVLSEIATYANGIGPDKSRSVAGNIAGNPLGQPTGLVRNAHRVGLLLRPFTHCQQTGHRRRPEREPGRRRARELPQTAAVSDFRSAGSPIRLEVPERVAGRVLTTGCV